MPHSENGIPSCPEPRTVLIFVPDAAARTFTGALFDSVAPGGTLLIGNLAPELIDIGYMEAFMDWHLVYRNESQLLALVDTLDGSLVAAARSYRDPHGNIVMLEVERRG